MTSGGKTQAFFSGSDSGLPCLSESPALRMYLPMTLLPAISSTMASDCKIGTELAYSEEKVRVNCAIEPFWFSLPKTGIFSLA
ncbi:hypothetical protein D3C73_1555990 [compost metagenome]